MTGDRFRSLYRDHWRFDLVARSNVPRLLSDAEIARVAARALVAAGAPNPASLSLILSSDSELSGLNATHMGESGPTDVLSFPLLPPGAYPDHPGKSVATTGKPALFMLPPAARQQLGDIVVSVERAIAQAGAGRGGQTGDVSCSPSDELRLLITHGVLHVCGWDHADPVEERAMRVLEQRLLAAGRQSRQ